MPQLVGSHKSGIKNNEDKNKTVSCDINCQIKLQLYCLIVMNFKYLTKHVEKAVIAEFTITLTKLACLNMIFNPRIKF